MDYAIDASFVLLGGIVAALPLFIISSILIKGTNESDS